MVIVLTILNLGVRAQVISGYVKDDKTREPIPFVNIWFEGTNIGTITNENGFFKMIYSGNIVPSFSAVGYVAKDVPLNNFEDGEYTVWLKEDVLEISEVRVLPEVSRAKQLFKQILKNKASNHDRIRTLEDYKTLAHTTVYLALDSNSQASLFVDNLEEVTMAVEGENIRYTPIYLSETAKQSAYSKDSIVYEKKDGIFPKLNNTIESQILLNVVVDLDFYKEQIDILGRGFASPINNSARMIYDIYLNDSVRIDSVWHYSFSFTPKNKYGALFTGRFTVEGKNFALTKMYAYVQAEANINFVNGFRANVHYQQIKNTQTWFYKRQDISLNLSLFSNKDTLKYDAGRVDEISSGNWLVSKGTQYSTDKDLNTIKARDWNNHPEFKSNRIGDNEFQKVDDLKGNAVVRVINGIAGVFLTRYISLGKVELGEVYDIYTANAIEGNRFSLPFRTSELLWENFMLGGFVGYATKSKEFKYGANAAWQIKDSDKLVLRARYSDDYKLVTDSKFFRFAMQNPNARGTGNIYAALTATERNPYLKGEKSIDVSFEYNGDENLVVEALGYYLMNEETPDVHFIRDNINYNTYNNYGLFVNFRFLFGQRYDKFFFSRLYYVDQTPIINFGFDIGKTDLPGNSESELGLYTHLHSSITGRLSIGQTYFKYMLDAGYLFGDAPYDLLDQPYGFMSVAGGKHHFNLLHHASFAHNIYSNLHVDYTMGGLILNKIPLIKKLKLREALTFKAHVGGLTNAYKPVFDLPGYYSNEISKPYAEVGIGITNIFKAFRVEYFHLLGNTYSNSDFTYNHGIRFKGEVSF